MKGIIFTEFLELVEDRFGLEVVDKMLEQSADDGTYTSVGSYDHRKLVTMIITLSKITGISHEDLQQVFGQAVFANLIKALPSTASLGQCKDAFQFIRHVEDYIHLEVKKLYPDAKPPRFSFISQTETEMVMDYHSARCLSHVCLGLIKGCADYFNQTVGVTMQALTKDQSQVRFTLVLEP